MIESSAQNDQRNQPRETVMRRGMLIHAETGQSFKCMIVDLSAGGAKLQIYSPGVPDGLLSLLDARSATSHDLRVVWRAGPFMGVCFEASAAVP